jgi:hypothetical protein
MIAQDAFRTRLALLQRVVPPECVNCSLVPFGSLRRAERLVELRHITDFTFTHHALMWFVDAFYAILKLAITLWRSFGNAVRSPWKVHGRANKHCLTDVKIMGRLGVQSRFAQRLYHVAPQHRIKSNKSAQLCQMRCDVLLMFI